MLHNYDYAQNGRIWMIWDDTLKVDLIGMSDQSITFCVENDLKKFIFSSIYGYNEGRDRRRLWSHLHSLQNSFLQEPWVLAGDFNVIAHLEESSKLHGSHVVTADMREFVEARDKLLVFNHAFQGLNFTWSNKHHPSDFLAKKLDRILVNDQWLRQFS